MDPNNIPIRATTQDHLIIEDILDDLIVLKDGSVCLLLQVSAVNFGLLSEQEQDATIFAYAGLLNSLTFSLQIVVKSQKKDISSYLRLLKKEEDKQKNPQIKERILKYRSFVENTVRENNVLDKKFYLIIPFGTLELGIQSAKGIFKKGLPFPKGYILEKAKTALFPKRDHLIRQFNRIGLKIEQLKTRQLIELFFKIYNPDSFGITQPGSPLDYETPLVEASVIAKTGPAPLPPLPAVPLVPAPVFSSQNQTIFKKDVRLSDEKPSFLNSDNILPDQNTQVNKII